MRLAQILRYLLALSFLLSGYTKFIAPGYFEITLMDQGLVSGRIPAAHLARLIIGSEWALGMLLLLPFYTRKLLLFSLALLVGMSIHLLYLWAIGDQENCGCFGEMIVMTPIESLMKNAVLMMFALGAYRQRFDKRSKQKWVLWAALLIIGSIWIVLPLPKPEAQLFREFSHFEPQGRVDLTQGEVLVAVFNLDCEHCQEAATALGQLTKEQSLPPIYVLFFQEGSTMVDQFETLTQTDFPYAFIDTTTFFDLIGDSPPRLYFLRDGKVIQFWDHAIAQGLKARFSLP